MDIANAEFIFVMKKQKGEPTTPSDQEVVVMGLLSELFGKEGTKRRFEWMYVNIVEDKRQYSVSSPIKMDKDVTFIDFRGIKSQIQLVERIIKFSKTKVFTNRLNELREIFKNKFDKNYPDESIWE